MSGEGGLREWGKADLTKPVFVTLFPVQRVYCCTPLQCC